MGKSNTGTIMLIIIWSQINTTTTHNPFPGKHPIAGIIPIAGNGADLKKYCNRVVH